MNGSHPRDDERPRERYSRRQRAFAGALLVFFLVVVIVTTALSLGAYCLTTDGAVRVLGLSVRALNGGDADPCGCVAEGLPVLSGLPLSR